MTIAASLLLLLCSCVGIALRYAPFAGIIVPQQKKRLWICYTVAILAKLISLVALMETHHVEGAFLYLRYGLFLHAVVLTLINILLIPGRIREHLFVFGVVMTCKYLLLTIPNYLVTLYPGNTPSAYLFIILISYTALLLGTYVPLRNLLRSTVSPFLQMETSSYWSTIWFIPIALFGTRYLQVGGAHNAGSLVQLFASGLYGAMVILICLSISRDHQREENRLLLEQQLTDQKTHYLALQSRVEDARKTRHDLKHHMAALLNMVERDDKEGVRHYCSSLMDTVQVKNHIPYTGNTAADGVLYHYLQRTTQLQIPLELRGVIHSHGIADMDLCVLLGNALDNALAGCLTIESGRFIQVVGQSENHLLSLMVRNSFDGQILKAGGDILSRKRENAPGVGLRSMETICRRYNGEMTLQYDENTFTVIFLLPLSE